VSDPGEANELATRAFGWVHRLHAGFEPAVTMLELLRLM
jgi:hypothetical protein